VVTSIGPEKEARLGIDGNASSPMAALWRYRLRIKVSKTRSNGPWEEVIPLAAIVSRQSNRLTGGGPATGTSLQAVNIPLESQLVWDDPAIDEDIAIFPVSQHL
jgi:hypothetical protein